MKTTRKTGKLFITALTILAVCMCGKVKAQSVPQSSFRFGIGIDGLLPVGNLTNTVNFGLGITPRLQYGLSNSVALTFTSGIYHYFTKDIYVPEGYFGAGDRIQDDLDVIPVKAGIKAFVASNIYLGAEAGAGFEVDNGGGPVKLILSPAVGYANKKWDVGIRYESESGQNYNYGILALRLAYGFGL